MAGALSGGYVAKTDIAEQENIIVPQPVIEKNIENEIINNDIENIYDKEEINNMPENNQPENINYTNETNQSIGDIQTNPSEQLVHMDNANISIKKSVFETKREKYAFVFFMTPIVIMSIVSMSHLVDFFSISSSQTIAWLLGFAFETASLATIIALVLLKKMNKFALWSVWILLFALQLIGNVYSPFALIDVEQAKPVFEFFNLNPSVIASKRIIAIISGAILPSATFFLFKIASDYLKADKE